MSASPSINSPHPGLSFRAFVAMVACMMMLNALAIDSMLPALASIGESLGVARENDRQWVVTAYLLGFGIAQLVHGTLSDRFGRRPVLIAGLAGYVVFSLVVTFSQNFAMLIVARGLQGVGAAASRVVAVSVVRDCYSGRPMARVMSLAFIVFLIVPILAPSVGTVVLMFGPWRWIFGLLSVLGALILTWTALKLPETLHPEFRRSIDPADILAAWARVARDRTSLGYTLAMTLLSGGLFGFINSVEQITADTFQRPHSLPLVFAAIGSCMAVGSFLNSRIVERLGTRRVSHTALIGLLSVGAVHLAIAATGHETLISFALLQALTMFCFSLCGANFGAMAMENLGSVAGAAASLQGFASTVGGALAGFAIGQWFDGTTVPVAAGFTAFGIMALVIVLVTERGRLFHAHHQPPVPA